MVSLRGGTTHYEVGNIISNGSSIPTEQWRRILRGRVRKMPSPFKNPGGQNGHFAPQILAVDARCLES